MLEILIFLLLGAAAGVVFGLIPGVHPNMIVLLVPVFAALPFPPEHMLTLIVSLAVVNSIVDMIPSVLLGAPEGGSELATLPGHRMLLSGRGYQAVKLTVTGSLGAVILVTALLPLIVFAIPPLFAALREYTHVLLIFIAAVMILSEPGARKFVALFAFLAAGSVGLATSRFPVDDTLILFPILAGLFGVSVLINQINARAEIPKQTYSAEYVSRTETNRSVLLGSVGGLFSGLLPGVGSSEVASLVSVDKNDHSFLTALGALTTANILISMLSLWLIGRARSGAAVVLDSLMTIGFSEFVLIASVALAAAGMAAFATLKLSRIFLANLQKVDYTKVSLGIIGLITALTAAFTGLYGLLLLAVCAALGLFAITSGIRRSSLMGVLILPTILFFAL